MPRRTVERSLSWSAARDLAAAAAGAYGLTIDDDTLRSIAAGVVGDDVLDDELVRVVAATELVDRVIGWARRPRWRLDRDSLTIAPDPSGTADLAALIGDLVALLTARAAVERRRQAVEELLANADPAERVARRWGVSRATLYRWAGQAGPSQNRRPNETPDSALRSNDRRTAPDTSSRRGSTAA